MLPWMCSFFDLTLWVSVSGPVLRRDAVSEWARVILVVKFLQCIVACVLQPSMFTQITVRLVSPFVEQVAAWEVGESDTTFLLFGLLGWFRQLLTRWWHWKRVVRFCHIFIYGKNPLFQDSLESLCIQHRLCQSVCQSVTKVLIIPIISFFWFFLHQVSLQ